MTLRKALPVILCTAGLMAVCGCWGQKEPYAGLDGLHEKYRRSTQNVSRSTGFFGALAGFDLENAAFLEDARAAVEDSRAAADELQEDLEDLRAYDYGREMGELGEDLAAYCEQADEALRELKELYQPLLELLEAMEPTLQEEAVLTQLDTPESDDEFVRRLVGLEEALARTLGDLPRVQVPEPLEKYQVLMEQAFTSLKTMADDLMALAGGQAVDFKLQDNEKMQHFQTIMALHDPLLLSIRDSLKINSLDAVMQRVEEGFYALFLERGSRDEERR